MRPPNGVTTPSQRHPVSAIAIEAEREDERAGAKQPRGQLQPIERGRAERDQRKPMPDLVLDTRLPPADPIGVEHMLEPMRPERAEHHAKPRQRGAGGKSSPPASRVSGRCSVG